ncbi:M42 family metallopeptidase [Candidatus Bathyarchaeota archaeon]|nr:M42 family metallopeptidase [Candidatus Bathyarchaeota archaeon]MBS7630145.1 M42 family metallopeptidase [Candidatus Bathyarchaeota archaeon]
MLNSESLQFMKELMEEFGPSGFERSVSTLCKKFMEPYSDRIIADRIGSLTFVSAGSTDRPRVLLAGHVDEVGFIISSITEEGYLTFNPLGGWWSQVLLGQRVTVRTRRGDILGVIAAKPPHILPEEERKKVVELKDMYIDIGATSKEEVEATGVKIGDPAIPWSPFSLLQDGKVAMGKAFDDRIGAFILMEVIKRIKEQEIPHPNTVYGAVTVQEEVGLRGAQTVSHVVDPDVALVLEVDIAGDVPGIKPQEAATRMGKGPGLVTFDRSMIPNPSLKEFIIDVAKQVQIPLQLSQMYGGGTDAGRIHLHKSGCPAAVITVPTRHIHSHVGLLSLRDTENAIRLTIELIKRLDLKIVEEFTSF